MSFNVKGAAISDLEDPDNESNNDHTRDIIFPNQSIILPQIAVDIGGSLAKVVWFSQKPNSHANSPRSTASQTRYSGGRLNFVKFETAHIEECIEFVKKVVDREEVPVEKRVIRATGGGAHKFYDLFKERLGITIHKEDEMECLITGLNFLVRQIPYEVFTYDERRPLDPVVYENLNSPDIFPYLLVNIGSGVSILKVTSDETFERVSGTSLGGGTLWGLMSLITDAESYDDMLEMSKEGDNKSVDMLVGDIYGSDYGKVGLKSTTIASSFGKVFKKSKEERKNIKSADISRSLLYMVSNNIGQIAYLNAQAHGVQWIYFSGFFIRGHPITMNTLNYAIHFWSKGKIKALFLRHEGYLGAMGAFLRSTDSLSPNRSQTIPSSILSSTSVAPTPANLAEPERRTRDHRIGSFTENFSHPSRISDFSPSFVGALESIPPLVQFPLVDSTVSKGIKMDYFPDTQDLSNDSELQKYWIDLLDVNLSNLVELAIQWKGLNDPAQSVVKDGEELEKNKQEKVVQFEEMYREHLKRLRKEPAVYGVMTVRSLLNLREQCLKEMGFIDIFQGVKHKETAAALEGLPLLLSKLDKMNIEELVDTILDNILAGNMYDWGSTAVQAMLKKGELDFNTAKSKVKQPAKFNTSYPLKKRLISGPAYNKCIIFVDNSGADIILGILPFVRLLLLQSTTVVLAANSRPSVNDVTASELREIVLPGACKVDEILKRGVERGKVIVVETGSGGPCLDLRRVMEEVTVEAKDADLVVLEGMGRAIHTNFYAKFKVDSLKIAVFKNPQVAEYLGAEMYDAISCLGLFHMDFDELQVGIGNTFNFLKQKIAEKDAEISEYKNRMQSLQTDFLFNLQLINERDAELNEKDTLIESLKVDLNDWFVKRSTTAFKFIIQCIKKSFVLLRESRFQQIKAAALDQSSEISILRSTMFSQQQQYELQLKNLRRDKTDLQRQFTIDLAKQAELMESEKCALESTITELKSEIVNIQSSYADKLTEISQTHSNELTEREHAHELFSTQLNHHITLLEKKCENLKNEKINCDNRIEEILKSHRERDYELTDSLLMAKARIEDLESTLNETNDRHFDEIRVRDEQNRRADLEKEKHMKDLVIERDQLKRKSEALEKEISRKNEEIDTVSKKNSKFIAEMNDRIRKKDLHIVQLEEEIRRMTDVSRTNELRSTQLTSQTENLHTQLSNQSIEIKRLKQSLQNSLENEQALKNDIAEINLTWERKYYELESLKTKDQNSLVKQLTVAKERAEAEAKLLTSHLNEANRRITELTSRTDISNRQQISTPHQSPPRKILYQTLSPENIPIDIPQPPEQYFRNDYFPSHPSQIHPQQQADSRHEDARLRHSIQENIELKRMNADLMEAVALMRNEMETLGKKLITDEKPKRKDTGDNLAINTGPVESNDEIANRAQMLELENKELREYLASAADDLTIVIRERDTLINLLKEIQIPQQLEVDKRDNTEDFEKPLEVVGSANPNNRKLKSDNARKKEEIPTRIEVKKKTIRNYNKKD
ncbi:hypothetical protein HK098_002604 [Nowakowskiella sp. JEL0407]|nr:hypothetical protein HK098_002604 [Nowakowskiella sp. JEL0407]